MQGSTFSTKLFAKMETKRYERLCGHSGSRLFSEGLYCLIAINQTK